METLLPLEEYEADPAFSALAPEEKDKFYSNFYSTAQEEAKTEDDYNQLLKWRADRKKSALQSSYSLAFPEDKEIDVNKAQSTESLAPLFQEVQNDYAQLDYNQNQAKVNKFAADDMEQTGREFAYKPFQYGVTKGYSVKYPDGTMESIKDIADEAQLTDYLRKNRLDKFQGKREGIFDSTNPAADSEFDMIYDKMRKTDAGLTGGFNAIRSRWASMTQGFDVADIVKDQEYINAPKANQAVRDKYTAMIADPNADQEEVRELRDQIAEYDRAEATGGLNKPEVQANIAQNRDKLSAGLKEKYADLAKDMQESEKIRGTRVLQQYQDHISNTAKEKRGDISTFTDYFKQNPGDFAPYLTAIATSSIPDMAAIIGTAGTTGLATGSPMAAGAAAGAVGFQMEYTGTLLSEMQLRAAEEGKQLYTPGVIESYIDDQGFMAGIEGKAMARAGIVGAADAVTGGASEAIVSTIKGSMKRAGAALIVDAASGAGGEAAAQYATEGKVNWTDVLNEGFGEMAGAPMTVARGLAGDAIDPPVDLSGPPKNVTHATKQGQAAVMAATVDASIPIAQSSRIAEMKEKFGINPPESQLTEVVETPPVVEKTPPIVQEKSAPQEFINNLDKTVADIDVEQTARVNAAKESFDRKDEGTRPRYEVNGIQKGFGGPTGDDWVPKIQTVTIRDSDHYADGSTILIDIPEGQTEATHEQIEAAITKKAEQEAIDEARRVATEESGEIMVSTIGEDGKLKTGFMAKDGSVRYDSGNEGASQEEDIKDSAQLTEKGPGMIFKALDWYNSVTGNKPKGTTDAGNMRVAAAQAMQNKLKNSVFSLLSETGSYDRVMKQARESNYDESSQGRMMGLLGLSADDSKRRVLTNVLGNFWSVNGIQASTTDMYNGLVMSEAIDQVYREEANVDSIYDMEEGKLNDISQKDLLLNMAPDDMMTDEEGYEYPVQSQAYSMGVDESVKRFNAGFKAKVIRAPKFDASLNNKATEATALKRPGINVIKLNDVTGTSQQQADHVIRSFDYGFVVKDAKGDNGRNIDFSTTMNSVQLTELIDKAKADGRANDVYFETMVFPRNGANMTRAFNEHRVHIYVDKKGNAHAFRNLTFNKAETYYDQSREAAGGNPDYDTHILIPGNVNDPKVAALQDFAEKSMSGKGFSDMIFGLDVGFTQTANGKEGHTIFEANALTYGMSGWLGNPISMSEIISEMTGKPSVLAGLYEIAKIGLSKEEIADIKDRVDQGMPPEYAAHPEYYDALNRGVAMFNKYLPSAKWLQAMRNLFTLPLDFFVKLYNTITRVFRGSVDRRFEAKQKIKVNFNRKSQSTEKETKLQKEYSKLLMPVPDGSSSNQTMRLGGYINRVLAHPDTTKPQAAVLRYIKKNASALHLSDIEVGRTTAGYNYYSTKKGKVGLKREGLTPRIAVHEIVHSVTSDLIEVNLQRVSLLLNKEYVDYDDVAQINEIYRYIVDPRNEDTLMDRGVQKDFIELAKTYFTFISDLGFGGPDSKLGGGNVSYEFIKNNPKVPYGAANLDEFVAEVLTKPEFQKKLAQLPPTKGNSRSMFSQIMQLLSRLIGIPYKHGGTLLSQAVAESLAIIKAEQMRSAYFFPRLEEDGTWVLRPSSPESEVTNVNGKPFLANEVSVNTQKEKHLADTEAQKSSVELQAEIDSLESRLSQLKAESEDMSKDNQARAKAIEPTIENLPQIREVAIDDLNEKMENEAPKKEYTMTAKRKEYMNRLQVNKALALNSLGEWINDSKITDGQADVLLDSIEYVLEQTEDPENLSTNALRYYTNVLQSMSDGGPPIGFKHIAPKMFIQKQVAKLQYIQSNPAQKGKSRVHIQAPAGNWRREIVGGIFQGGAGSTMQQASEISYMGLSEAGHQFLRDLMGYYKDNIDLQNLEEAAVKTDFYQTVKTAFSDPITPLQSKRIGVVARLTQYDKNRTEAPQAQILSRLSQVIAGIEVEKEYNKDDGELSNVAVTQILNGANLATFPDHQSILSFLEARLTPAEKAVLDKLRAIGQLYMPVLQTVKAITKQTTLQDFANYVHDANVHPAEEATEQNMLKAFTSMSDILHDRKGINLTENNTYAELDITAIADKQIRSSTYEKHTGMQRYMLANSLADGSQLTELLDADTNSIRKPVTNRLRTLLASYHNAMTTSQHNFTGLWGLVDAAMNMYVGTKIVGANAFVKNAVSSSIARFSLNALSSQALRDSMSYDNHRSEINVFLKQNFPTQYNRTGEYDIIEGSKDRFGVKAKYQRGVDIGHAPFWSALRTLPGMPREGIQKINDTVMSSLSNVSNGFPEKYSAHAIWTAAYVHFMKQNGSVRDMADFLARKPIDRRAANDANDFVSNALGYSNDKAAKGTYWNSSTATKRILSKAYSVFRQQSTGLALDFQNNIQKAARLFASGNYKEGRNAMALASTSLANSMSFRGLTIALSGSMMWGGLDRYFNAPDEEKKKKALMEAKRKYTENANRNNMRDFISESLLMLAPVATSAAFVENAVAGLMDQSKLVVGLKGGLKGIEIERKEDLRVQIDDITKQIEVLEKAARTKMKHNLSTQAEDETIEKLEVIKAQLTEKFKFKYFPSQSEKAYLSAFGSYGIAEEFVNQTIEDMIGDDLDTEEKKQLKASLMNEFSYRDPMAGEGYGLQQVNDMMGFARKLIPTEHLQKNKDEGTPNSLFWMEYFKLGQNPKVVIERARKALAEDAVRERIAAQKKAARIEARWADKHRD